MLTVTHHIDSLHSSRPSNINNIIPNLLLQTLDEDLFTAGLRTHIMRGRLSVTVNDPLYDYDTNVDLVLTL